jgi:hypothetical protein
VEEGSQVGVTDNDSSERDTEAVHGVWEAAGTLENHIQEAPFACISDSIQPCWYRQHAAHVWSTQHTLVAFAGPKPLLLCMYPLLSP